MKITTKHGAIGALIAVLALGIAACQPQGTATSIAADGADAGMETWLAKPDGDGPFPAVVLLHGCSGTERTTSHQTVWRGLGGHAALLNENGYVTLIVDSFGPRGITDGCQTGAKYYSVQAEDAHAAFDHLASLPFVDQDRIGVVGLSLGGGTALHLAQGYSVNVRMRKDRGTFAALVAYYPWCEPGWAYSLVRPVLILIGSEDDWTPAGRCTRLHDLASAAVEDKPVLELKVYPGAHHSFDLPMHGPYYVEGDPGVFHTVQGDGAARRDSQRRMIAFFDEHLAPAR